MRRIIMVVLTGAVLSGQMAGQVSDPGQIGSEIQKAKVERRGFLVVEWSTFPGFYSAFDPDGIAEISGNRLIPKRRTKLLRAQVDTARADDAKIYHCLLLAWTFTSYCKEGVEVMDLEADKIEVKRIVSVPELEPVPEDKKLWERIVFREMGWTGGARVLLSIAVRKVAPKPTYQAIVLRLANPGSTGLKPEMEAAFMRSAFGQPSAKAKAIIVRSPAETVPSGTVLDVALRVQKINSKTVGVSYVGVDRSTGEVRYKGLGRVLTGSKEEKDLLSLATSLALPK